MILSPRYPGGPVTLASARSPRFEKKKSPPLKEEENLPLQNSLLTNRITATKFNVESATKLGTVADTARSIEARAARKLYEDIFKANQISSRIDDEQVIASLRARNRKNLIMTEYIRMRKEAVQKLKQGI